MKTLTKEKTYQAHLFVCTNVRDGAKSCGTCGGIENRDLLKAKVAAKKEWKGKVRINASGCLGHCEEGPVAVLYPSNEWFTEVQASDCETILQKIEKEILK